MLDPLELMIFESLWTIEYINSSLRLLPEAIIHQRKSVSLQDYDLSLESDEHQDWVDDYD